MQNDEPGLFDMPEPEQRAPRRNPHRGRNRETWVRRVTAEVTIIDAAAVERAAADAERNAVSIDLGGVPDGEDVDTASEETAGTPVDLVAWMIWATDGQHDLLEAGAFRLLEITSDVVEESGSGGVLSWSSTVTLTDVERLREAASRTHAADIALIEDDLTIAWNHAADPYAPIRSIPGVEWQPLTAEVEHLPARPGRPRGRPR